MLEYSKSGITLLLKVSSHLNIYIVIYIDNFDNSTSKC